MHSTWFRLWPGVAVEQLYAIRHLISGDELKQRCAISIHRSHQVAKGAVVELHYQPSLLLVFEEGFYSHWMQLPDAHTIHNGSHRILFGYRRTITITFTNKAMVRWFKDSDFSQKTKVGRRDSSRNCRIQLTAKEADCQEDGSLIPLLALSHGQATGKMTYTRYCFCSITVTLVTFGRESDRGLHTWKPKITTICSNCAWLLIDPVLALPQKETSIRGRRFRRPYRHNLEAKGTNIRETGHPGYFSSLSVISAM
jgi:hypothetical protein